MDGRIRQGRTPMQEHLFSRGSMSASIASVPFLQAIRPHVQGDEQLHGFKIQFKTRWLDK
jgi:hypothetical protein